MGSDLRCVCISDWHTDRPDANSRVFDKGQGRLRLDAEQHDARGADAQFV